MADYAPNYTARLRVKYSCQSRVHTCTWRMPPGTVLLDIADFATKFDTFITALADRLYSDWAVLSWAYSLADSDIFLPYGGAALLAPGTVSVAGRPASAAAGALSFVGRSIAGHRASFFLYGIGTDAVTDPDNLNFRINANEDTDISTALAVLNDTPPPLVANDGNDVVWYEYVNWKYNDYWVRKTR